MKVFNFRILIAVVSLLVTLFLFQNCDEYTGSQPPQNTHIIDQTSGSDSLQSEVVQSAPPVHPLLNDEFFIGVNYAWTQGGFGRDFGGEEEKVGVSQRRPSVENDFRQMRDNGITVVRWWMFPKFFSAGVQIDQAGNVRGIRGSLLADLEMAIDIAQEYDVKIMFCFFSFDNFTKAEGFPLLSNVLKDPNKLNQMAYNLIAPIVRRSYEYINEKGYKDVIHSWDIINEPEWAIERQNPGNKDVTDFEPCKKTKYTNLSDGQAYDFCYGNEEEKDTDTVTLDQMENLVQVASSTIKSINSQALVNVGFASAKWANLWTNKLRDSVDFYQVHIYEWVHKFVFPYDTPLHEYKGLENKPVIMGEYPVYIRDDQLGVIDHLTLLSKWYDLRYSGVMAWHFNSIDDILPEFYGRERFLNDTKAFSERIKK